MENVALKMFMDKAQSNKNIGSEMYANVATSLACWENTQQ
jgi:hypothetical protein